MKFSDLELLPPLQGAIDQLGYTETTPIQQAVMPHVLEGRDVAGLAQTGTGKTAAFLIPLMERILQAKLNPDQLDEAGKDRRAKRQFPDWRPRQFILVLVPTRELADQVNSNVEKLAGNSGLRSVSIFGGVSYEKQKQGLRDGVEFIVATPGRLIDLYKEHLVDLKQVRAIVFDEADRMFDMGFKDDMKFILSRVPKDRQFMVFSATLNLDVMNTAYQFGASPVDVDVSRDQTTAENVDDKIIHCGSEEKGSILLSLLRLHKPKQAIIFSNFKMNVPRVAQFLNINEQPAVGISSMLTQSQRTRVMELFKADNDRNLMVATDVAARGLDIKGVDMVINYELPDDPENYVHRIGRTGRAGSMGKAFSLVSDRDIDALARIESYLKEKLESIYLEDSDLVKEFNPMPSDRDAFRGGDRRPREGGSGPRGPRPERSGGGPRGRHERGRGPRDGRRDERPRQDHRRHEGRGGQGAGGQGGEQQARGEGQPNGPARHHGRRPEGGRHDGRPEGRHEGQGRHEGRQEGQGRHGGGGRHHRDRGHQQGRRHGGEQGKGRPQHSGRSHRPTNAVSTPNAHAASKQSLGKKVSGFFKKLFGG